MILHFFRYDAARRVADLRPLWLSAIGVSLALVLFAPSRGDAHFVQSSYAFGANGCTVEQRSDPVTMIFYGSLGTAAYSDATVRSFAGWTWRTGNDQWLQSHGLCNQFNFQDASAITLTRYHVRLWQMPGLDLKDRYVTYATPHHEDFVIGGGCGIPGNHAIDANGSQGSGFDQGRTQLGTIIGRTYPLGDIQNWQNTQTFRQCDGDLASSNGLVLWYRLGSG